MHKVTGPIPNLVPGYKRKWVQCVQCLHVAYYDYVPYSLSSPVMNLPCGHNFTSKFTDRVIYLKELDIRITTASKKKIVFGNIK